MKHCLIFLTLISLGFCTSCNNPDVSFSYFTSQDATIVTNIAYISEFSVKCQSGNVNQLYADVGGSVVPVAAIGSNKYQVSWTEEIKAAQRGSIKVRLFDEDGFTALRKAMRAGEDTSSVAPLFEVSVEHSGAFNGPWLKSELLAAILSFVVAYTALSSRSKLLSSAL